MRVFRTRGQSRMHPKVCSVTETSAADAMATDATQKANPARSRLRLNIRLPLYTVLLGVVEDDPERVALAPGDPADSVAHGRAIVTARGLHRTVAGGEDQDLALLGRDRLAA